MRARTAALIWVILCACTGFGCVEGPPLTVDGDPRITRAGRWLRRLKFDELPQLFNVLRGEMSLVGPRPEVPKYIALYDGSQRRVLDLRPGITDPASLEYRDEDERLALAADPERMYVREILRRIDELRRRPAPT